MKKERRYFDKEYKEMAVSLCLTGRSPKEVADELGNIERMIHAATNGSWTRHYHYGFNSGGNANDNYLLSTNIGATSNKPSTDQYTYDAHGNMTKMPHLSAMTWDYADRLQSADLGGGGMAYYAYDANGDRARKVIENGNITEERIYIGDWEVYRKTVSGTLDTERETLHISDDTGRIALIDTQTVENQNQVASPQNLIRYQYSNHLGSASLELDDNAAIISYEEYHPFGSTSYQSGRSASEVSLKRYRYVGKERDEETGLYYYGARYYAPWLARFISTDPLKDDYPYYSSYQYAGNKPINNVDLDGLEPDPNTDTGGQGPKTDNYTVKSGDSLSKIAKANNLSLDELVGLNEGTLKKGVKTIIHPGDVLNLRDPLPEIDSSFLNDLLLVETDNTFVAQRDFEAEIRIAEESKQETKTDTSKPDYEKIAKKLGVEKEVVQAIATVESSGSGFYKNGNPKVRFEGHWFRKYQKGKDNFSTLQKDNSDIIYPYSKSSSKKHGSAEYQKALKLDSESAMLSTSFGAFQIMGFNFKAAGHESVKDFVDAQKTTAGQVESFMSFISSNKAMLKAMKDKDFAKFAELYNGPDYAVNKYDTKMKNLYNKLKKK